MLPRTGDRVRVLQPGEWRGYVGMVEAPLWCPEEGCRRIGVRLDATARVEWVTAVEILTARRFDANPARFDAEE